MKSLRTQSKGFSLVEMLVAIGLLSLVMVVLFSLFNQTTKAMRANSNQTDVMESARTGLESLSRDFESMLASGLAGVPNFVAYPNQPGRELFTQSVENLGHDLAPVQYDVYFLERVDSKRAKVVGYIVRNEDRSSSSSLFPVGSLYRYEDPDSRMLSQNLSPTVDANIPFVPINLSDQRASNNLVNRLLIRPALTSQTNMPDGTIGTSHNSGIALGRIIDGVVSFKVTAYDQYDRPLDPTIRTYLPFVNVENSSDRRHQPPILADFSSATLQVANRQNDDRASVYLAPFALGSAPNQFYGSLFLGEKLPTAIEIELAVIEPRTLDQIRGLAVAARDTYLRQNLGRIQIFRQRVPIRTAQR